jgi:uncharacterized protein GlcG (DUF336 family)
MRTSLVCAALVGAGLALGLSQLAGTSVSPVALANGPACPVDHSTLVTKLQDADTADSTGLNNHYWAVVVGRDGVVCAVAYSGANRDSQWLLSRQIAAAKAFTANGLSLESEPLSSGQLYSFVQPGAPAVPLFGLAGGNPVSAEDAYKGAYHLFGTANDPMVGRRVGGTITFGGGLALYNGTSPIGGVGLSGDTACADHSTAWRLRALLGLEPSAGNDRITLDASAHPHCPNDAATQGTN